MNNKIIITISFTAILFGCATSTLVMNQTTKNSLKGKTITFVEESSSSYSRPYINGGIQFIGNVVSSIYVDTTITNLDIPRHYISNKILPFIAKKYNMKYTKEKAKKQSEDAMNILVEKPEIPELDRLQTSYSSDYLVVIDTYDWFVYTSGNTGIVTYNLILRNNFKLIEREKKKVISSINCEYLSGIKKSPLFDNDAKLFKEENKKATKLCIKKIQYTLFQ